MAAESEVLARLVASCRSDPHSQQDRCIEPENREIDGVHPRQSAGERMARRLAFPGGGGRQSQQEARGHPWGLLNTDSPMPRIRPIMMRAMVERLTRGAHGSLSSLGSWGRGQLARPGIGCSEVSGVPDEASRRRGKKYA